MPDETKGAVLPGALSRILRPLVRILLRRGVACSTLLDLVKRVYVQEAERSCRLPGKRQSDSRLAVLTGLTRQEIGRLRAETAPTAPSRDQGLRQTRAERAVAGWRRDAAYLGPDGEPRVLPFADDGSFAELVRRHCGDIPPRAVLDELMRVGAVLATPEGGLRLVKPAYVPAGDEEKLDILGSDGADLLRTVEHNLAGEGASRLQLTVAYDAIPEAAVPELRHRLTLACHGLIRDLDRELAARDAEAGQADAAAGNRMRLGVGIYVVEGKEEP